MDNEYLGGIIIAATLLLMALAYRQFRRLPPSRVLDNETAATIASFLLTTVLSLGITVFAGNASMANAFGTIVSVVVILAAFVVLTVTIVRSHTSPTIPAVEPCTPAPIALEMLAANNNQPVSGQGRVLRKAA